MSTWTITEKLETALNLINEQGDPFNSKDHQTLIKQTIEAVMEKVRAQINSTAHHHLCQHVLATTWAYEDNETILRKWVVYVFTGPEYFENKVEKQVVIWLIPGKEDTLEFAITVETEFAIHSPSGNVKYNKFSAINLEKELIKVLRVLKKEKLLKKV